jgi:hypothetical protein
MFSNYRGYYNKESELQRCMTDHRIKKNPLSSFENKQRSFSNISYIVFFTYFTIYALSRTSDITETRNLCVIKVILLACFTYNLIFFNLLNLHKELAHARILPV